MFKLNQKEVISIRENKAKKKKKLYLQYFGLGTMALEEEGIEYLYRAVMKII